MSPTQVVETNSVSGVRHKPWGQFGHPRGVLGSIVGWVMATENRERNRLIVEALPLTPGMRVLEIGFGPGVALHDLLERLEGGNVVGIDHSAAMVRQATRRNRTAIEARRLKLYRGTVDSLASPELGGFDLAFAVNVFHHVKEAEGMLAQVHSLLTEGGRFWLAHQPPMTRDPSVCVEMLEEMEEQARRSPFAGVKSWMIEAEPIPICVVELVR